MVSSRPLVTVEGQRGFFEEDIYATPSLLDVFYQSTCDVTVSGIVKAALTDPVSALRRE